MNINKLLETGDTADIVMEVFDALLEQTKQGEKTNLLKPGALVFYHAQNFDHYMNNDGFTEFFAATSPEHIKKTIDALEAIGANKMNGILQKAIAVWPTAIPEKRDEREDRLLTNMEAWTKIFDKLTNEYLLYPDEMDILLVNYVEKFKTDFD